MAILTIFCHLFEAENCVSNSSFKWLKNTHKKFTRVNVVSNGLISNQYFVIILTHGLLFFCLLNSQKLHIQVIEATFNDSWMYILYMFMGLN